MFERSQGEKFKLLPACPGRAARANLPQRAKHKMLKEKPLRVLSWDLQVALSTVNVTAHKSKGTACLTCVGGVPGENHCRLQRASRQRVFANDFWYWVLQQCSLDSWVKYKVVWPWDLSRKTTRWCVVIVLGLLYFHRSTYDRRMDNVCHTRQCLRRTQRPFVKKLTGSLSLNTQMRGWKRRNADLNPFEMLWGDFRGRNKPFKHSTVWNVLNGRMGKYFPQTLFTWSPFCQKKGQNQGCTYFFPTLEIVCLWKFG